jgi:flagellar assembly protein FliH
LSARAKFMFDVDFAAGSDPARRGITPAAHEAALAEARAKAYRDGVAAAVAEAEARSAVALERIAATLEDTARRLAAIETRLEAEAVEVAVAVARKLAPELIAREPLAEIAALARGCFAQLVAAPHVVVRVSDALHAPAREQLEQTARLHGFDGRLIVLGEPEIASGDCRIEWADGGIVRDRAATDAAIAAAVNRYAAARRAAFEG